MDFMKASCADHGYTMEYDKKIVTGKSGCPQTRVRLLIQMCNKGLVQPAMPEPIMEDWNVREVSNSIKKGPLNKKRKKEKT
jgi:hypothetical protein